MADLAPAGPDEAPAGADEAQRVQSSGCHLTSLPDCIEAHLLGMLPLIDAARVACTCQALRRAAAAALRRVRVLRADTLGTSTARADALAWAAAHCPLLQSIVLDVDTTDEHIAALLSGCERGSAAL